MSPKKREESQEKQQQHQQQHQQVQDQQQQRIIVGDEKLIRSSERRAEITAALAKKYEGKSREVSEAMELTKTSSEDIETKAMFYHRAMSLKSSIKLKCISNVSFFYLKGINANCQWHGK